MHYLCWAFEGGLNRSGESMMFIPNIPTVPRTNAQKLVEKTQLHGNSQPILTLQVANKLHLN